MLMKYYKDTKIVERRSESIFNMILQLLICYKTMLFMVTKNLLKRYSFKNQSTIFTQNSQEIQLQIKKRI